MNKRTLCIGGDGDEGGPAHAGGQDAQRRNLGRGNILRIFLSHPVTPNV